MFLIQYKLIELKDLLFRHKNINKRYQGEFSETFLSRYLWRIEELSQWAAPLWELYHRTSQTTQHLRGHAPLGGQKLRESLPCSCTPRGGDATPTSRLNGFVGWTCGWGWNIKSDSYFLLQIILCYKLLPFVWQNKNIFSTQYVCNLLMQWFWHSLMKYIWKHGLLKSNDLSCHMSFLKQKVIVR